MVRKIIEINEELCNGCGSCVITCAENAIAIVDGKAKLLKDSLCDGIGNCVGTCPQGALVIVERDVASSPPLEGCPQGGVVFGNWPLKILLVSPHAPFFDGADLVIGADCAAFAEPEFHKKYADGKPILIGCPKFSDVNAFVHRLEEIFRLRDVKSCTVVRMQVPCCRGLSTAVHEAKRRADANVEVIDEIVNIR
jgi:NAD-dependent dihydropyrimidine dehydrogenase PreA subunit